MTALCATVDRRALVAELSIVTRTAPRRTLVPILSHVLLDAIVDNLVLTTTDLDVTQRGRLAAKVTNAGSVCVNAARLLRVVRNLGGDEVHLAQDDWRLRVASESAAVTLHGIKGDDFPPTNEVPSCVSPVIFPATSLRRMIAKILFAVSAEESRFQLNGALFKVKDGALEIAATDGHRLVVVGLLLDGPATESQALVPRGALAELGRYRGIEDVLYRRGDTHLSFAAGNRELICRASEGTFPNYEAVIAAATAGNKTRVVVDRRRLAGALSRARALEGRYGKTAARIALAPELLQLRYSYPDIGVSEESVACEYEGPSIAELGVNPRYLAEWVASVGDASSVQLQIKDEHTAMLLVPSPEPESRHVSVLMPMTLRQKVGRP